VPRSYRSSSVRRDRLAPSAASLRAAASRARVTPDATAHALLLGGFQPDLGGWKSFEFAILTNWDPALQSCVLGCESGDCMACAAQSDNCQTEFTVCLADQTQVFPGFVQCLSGQGQAGGASPCEEPGCMTACQSESFRVSRRPHAERDESTPSRYSWL